jgi:hypothetical protein
MAAIITLLKSKRRSVNASACLENNLRCNTFVQGLSINAVIHAGPRTVLRLPFSKAAQSKVGLEHSVLSGLWPVCNDRTYEDFINY